MDIQELKRKINKIINDEKMPNKVKQTMEDIYKEYEQACFECKYALTTIMDSHNVEQIKEIQRYIRNDIEENKEIPNDIIENLSIGLFDYKARKHPFKLMNIIDYIVRINSNGTYAVSFIENEDDVIILTYDKKDKIVDKTTEFIKLYTDKINTILGREKYER